MTSSLRMLTYNTQLRSWAMQVGASPGYTLPPIDTAEERATIIAEKLKASRFDYDVVDAPAPEFGVFIFHSLWEPDRLPTSREDSLTDPERGDIARRLSPQRR